MSQFTYGDITLPYPTHTQFSQEAVYDASGTDKVYTQFTITVQGILNTAYADVIGTGGASGAAIMAAIRAKLLTPRQKLSVQVNGVELIPTSSADGRDAKLGPQPQNCQVLQLYDTSFLITFRIIAHYVDSSAQGNGGRPTVISNRWTEKVSIDQCQFSTRNRSGKFVIRTDTPNGLIPDQLRTAMAVVGVPGGFIRTQADYTISPDGTTLSYELVDREQYKMPPPPAYEASGTYTEIVSGNGVVRHGEVELHLKASKTVDQSQLVRTAMAVATQKLIGATNNAAGNKNVGIGKIEQATVSVNMYANEVKVRMRGRHNPRTTADGHGRVIKVAGVKFDGMTFTPLSDGVNYQPLPLDRGTASLLLQAAAFFDPAVAHTLSKKQGQIQPGKPITG